MSLARIAILRISSGGKEIGQLVTDRVLVEEGFYLSPSGGIHRDALGQSLLARLGGSFPRKENPTRSFHRGGVLNVSHHLLDLGPDGFQGCHAAQVDDEYHGSCPHCPPINLSWRGSDLVQNSPEKRHHQRERISPVAPCPIPRFCIRGSGVF